MKDRIMSYLLGALLSFMLAALFLNLFLSATIATGPYGQYGPTGLATLILQLLAIGCGSLSFGFAVVSSFHSINEAMSSGNGDEWKLFWSLFMVFVFPLGLVLYIFLARSHLELKIPRPKPHF